MKQHHAIATIRDIVEVVAIVAAGIWAFYVFAYENRIKPLMASPDIDVTASLQRLSERNGLIGVGIRTEFRNVGTVKAHFLGVAVNVYGQRIDAGGVHLPAGNHVLKYEYRGFYHEGPPVTVFSYGYVTQLGDPTTTVDAEIDPGSSIEGYRAFYVPRGKFDLLTVGIDIPYTKYEDRTVPSRLVVAPDGSSKIVTQPEQEYKITPVTSLDIR